MMTNNIAYRFIVTYQEKQTNKNKGTAFERSSSDWVEALLVLKQLLQPEDQILAIEMKEVLSQKK